MNNSVESWIAGLKQKKLVIAGDLNLVRGEAVPVDFNFDDIAELFKTHVAFTDDKKDKEDKAKTPSPAPVKRKTKKVVKRKGPPIKKWKAQ